MFILYLYYIYLFIYIYIYIYGSVIQIQEKNCKEPDLIFYIVRQEKMTSGP